MADFKAQIDREGTVHLQVGGRQVAFRTPDRIHDPGFQPGGPAFGQTSPKRPNPTKWPPVVTYVIGAGDEDGLVQMDLTDLMTVEVGDIEVVVRSIRELPWASSPRTEILVSVSDAEAGNELLQGLHDEMGSETPQVRMVEAPPEAGAAAGYETDL